MLGQQMTLVYTLYFSSKAVTGQMNTDIHLFNNEQYAQAGKMQEHAGVVAVAACLARYGLNE